MIGGPACGKTITAANVRAQLGFKGHNIELVDEKIKNWTYIPRTPKSCDNFYIQACQVQKEDLILRSGVDLIVTDSPLILQYFYAKWHKVPLQEPMRKIALEFERIYPSLHIFIGRKDEFYSSVGRYEKLEEAKKIDEAIKDTLVENNISFSHISCVGQDTIIEAIEIMLNLT